MKATLIITAAVALFGLAILVSGPASAMMGMGGRGFGWGMMRGGQMGGSMGYWQGGQGTPYCPGWYSPRTPYPGPQGRSPQTHQGGRGQPWQQGPQGPVYPTPPQTR